MEHYDSKRLNQAFTALNIAVALLLLVVFYRELRPEWYQYQKAFNDLAVAAADVQLSQVERQSKIDQEFVDILLEKGNESRAKNLDNRKTLAGQMDYEYYYKDFKEWFCPLFDPYISAYQMGAMGEGLNLFKKPVIGYQMISLWINYQQA